jgi:hypothetical protein
MSVVCRLKINHERDIHCAFILGLLAQIRTLISETIKHILFIHIPNSLSPPPTPSHSIMTLFHYFMYKTTLMARVYLVQTYKPLTPTCYQNQNRHHPPPPQIPNIVCCLDSLHRHCSSFYTTLAICSLSTIIIVKI